MDKEKKAIEKLNPDDLKDISGGFIGDIVNDSIYLNDLGLLPDNVGDVYTLFNWDEATSFVEKGWAKVGITCVTSFECCNDYYYRGQKIRRDDVLEIARKACIKGPQIRPQGLELFLPAELLKGVNGPHIDKGYLSYLRK